MIPAMLEEREETRSPPLRVDDTLQALQIQEIQASLKRTISFLREKYEHTESQVITTLEVISQTLKEEKE